jgi:hypothetical protein
MFRKILQHYDAENDTALTLDLSIGPKGGTQFFGTLQLLAKFRKTREGKNPHTR